MNEAPSVALKPRAIRELRFVVHPESDTQYVHFENSAQHPFTSAQSGIGRCNAWWLAEAALLAYWSTDVAVTMFRSAGLEAAYVGVDGAQCYVAVGSDFVIVAFRGTQMDEWQDIYDDARFALDSWGNAGARVHYGFRQAYARIREPLLRELAANAPSRRVWFAGHSLGGALAMLAADDWGDVEGVLTIGGPRVGDSVFATAYDAHFAARSVRYVNNNDLVTHLPPAQPFGYRHVRALRRIDAQGSIGSAVPEPLSNLAELVTRYTNAPTTPVWSSLLDHMPRGYAVDIWNDYARNGDTVAAPPGPSLQP